MEQQTKKKRMSEWKRTWTPGNGASQKGKGNLQNAREAGPSLGQAKQETSPGWNKTTETMSSENGPRKYDMAILGRWGQEKRLEGN